MSTPERTLSLLGLLQRQREWTGDDLADRLEVSKRTVRRDVDRLRSLGYPIESDRGVDGGYRLAPGATLPPLVLSDDEAVALVVALRTAALTSIGGASELAVEVLSKVSHVLPAKLRRRADAVSTMTDLADWTAGNPADLAVLTAIADAALAVEQVEIGYRDKGGVATQRLIEPVRLVLHRRRWYLVAYDVGRHDWRTFRLDRIGVVERTGRRYVPKPVPGGDPVDYVRSSLGDAPATHTVEVIVDLPAGEVERRYGRWCVVTEVAAERCRIVTHNDTFDWPVLMLGALDAPFTVVGDDAFRAHLTAIARRFAGAALA